MTSTEMSLSLSLLRFDQSFPVSIHPQCERIEQAVEALCQRLDVRLPHFTNYSTMTCYVYPYAPEERVITIGLIMNLLFYIDDTFEKSTQDHGEEAPSLTDMVNTCLKIMRTGQRPDSTLPLYEAAQELHHRLWKRTNPAWFRRFVESLKEYIALTMIQGQLESQEWTNLEQYVEVRERDSGVWSSLYLIEFANDAYLPDALFEHEHMQRLMHLAGQIAGLSNDLFSYAKEVNTPKEPFNLISVLMKSRGLSLPEALQQAIDHINHLIAQFEQGLSHLPDFDDETLNHTARLYAQGLWHLVGAMWHWQRATNRYRAPNSPFVELRTTV
jgi:hypothetical protein